MGKGDLVILFSPQLLAGSGEWRYLGLCGPGSVGHCGKSPPPHTLYRQSQTGQGQGHLNCARFLEDTPQDTALYCLPLICLCLLFPTPQGVSDSELPLPIASGRP